jgi:hypothetical protein
MEFLEVKHNSIPYPLFYTLGHLKRDPQIQEEVTKDPNWSLPPLSREKVYNTQGTV